MNLNSKYLMSEKGLQLLAKLFHSSGEGIMVFNQDGKVEMINPRAEEMFGYPEKEIIGQPVEILVPDHLRKNHKTHRKSYIKDAVPRPMGLGLDLHGKRKDGSEFPLEISLSFVDHEDEPLVVAFITDISIRKESEKILQDQRMALEEYATKLEQKVKERTSELEHMNMGLQSQIQERRLAERALKKSLTDLKRAENEILKSLEKEKELGELKSRFVSMASHEFRTPLTTILSSANLIKKYEEKDQQSLRDKHINRISKSVHNLTKILNDFLSMEKLESGVQKIEMTQFNLGELLDEVVDEINPTLKKGQQIKTNTNSIQFVSDRHILKNILFNLTSNASKYSEEGSPINLEVHQDNGNIEILVQDHGIGIPKSEQKNLFTRFFRAANAVNIQGTGLGLNIVKKYTDLLNGDIRFESEEEKGTKFIVVLPFKN